SRAPSRGGKTSGPRALPRKKHLGPGSTEQLLWTPPQSLQHSAQRSGYRQWPEARTAITQFLLFGFSTRFSFLFSATHSSHERPVHFTNSGARPWDHGSYVCANRMRSSSGG